MSGTAQTAHVVRIMFYHEGLSATNAWKRANVKSSVPNTNSVSPRVSWMPVPVYFSAFVNCSVVRLALTSTRADAQRAAQTLRGLSLRSSIVLKIAVLIAATGFRAEAYVTDGAAAIELVQ